MRRILSFIGSMLVGPAGDTSSKRMVVVWLMVILTAYIFGIKEINFNIVAAILTAVTAILGVQAVTKT
jgi:hypothetical protein